MKQLMYIELILENQDSICFQLEQINTLLIKGIKKNKMFSNNEFKKFNTAEYISISIYPDGYNKKYLDCVNEDSHDTIKERLMKGHDVLSLVLHYNNTTKEYNVQWDNDSNYFNKCQLTEIKNDILYLTIK